MSLKSNFQVQHAPKGHIISPATRFLPPDITTPKFEDLVDLALRRTFHAAYPLETLPPRIFPTTETVFATYHSLDDWLVHGDLETELGRMSYILSDLPERGIPARCIGTICSVLSSASVLTAWKRGYPRLKNEVAEEGRWIIHQMQKQQKHLSASCYQKARFIAVPVDYKIDPTTSCNAIRLWERSLLEIVLQVSKGHLKHAEAFLQIFSFLKDPLGGLQGVFNKAVDLFIYMMTSLASSTRQTPGSPLAPMRWYAAVAQAAQEALFLASPLLENITYIHFTGHQQLSYIYVELDQLRRSEFSIPEHVLHIIEEILTIEFPQHEGSCPIAPISVSSYPALPIDEGKHMTVIIDGNHRATATMILRLIAENPAVLTTGVPGEVLDTFCTDHELGSKWKVDLAEVLEALRGSLKLKTALPSDELERKEREGRGVCLGLPFRIIVRWPLSL
ncbi:hypothetical protein FQN49_007699 [Arthroderma sp. PD_2]|nr:hypothetical protein FQN49_007699 [Arthroderma sp. PD_2]